VLDGFVHASTRVSGQSHSVRQFLARASFPGRGRGTRAAATAFASRVGLKTCVRLHRHAQIGGPERDGESLKVRQSIETMAAIWAHVRLLIDIWSMKLFVGILGRNGELLDSHLFFYVRYSDLSEYHRSKGRTARADRLAAIAEAHYQAAPDDDEPLKTAAMAMPVPLPPLNTNAVSTTRIIAPVEPPSDLVPSPAS